MIGMVLLSMSTFVAFLVTILPGFKVIQTKTGAKVVETLTAASAFLIGSAFFYLAYAFLTSDLTFLNVALNSHSASDVLYKISGIWGNHEGSLLLWLVLLTTISTIFVLQKHITWPTRLAVARVLGSISFCFHMFILLVSNPFVQLHQVPKQGMGLNPLLEDPALAIHPPILYTGLALLSTLYAMASVGLKRQEINREWAKRMQPWAIACWTFLTIGIALGSWWAYYELGWGGWWFWDPVENLSLLPWLIITALLHSLNALDKSGDQQLTAPLLALLAFILALFSLFLVRSGMLSSVHAFAVDPYRGGFLGAIFGIYTLYGIRCLLAHGKSPSHPTNILSRESFLFINILLLSAIMVVVLTGTVYPLALQHLTGTIISVGAPYFNASTLPFLLFMVLLMVAIPFVGWRLQVLNKNITYVLTAGLATFLIISYMNQGWPVMANLFLAGAICVLIATIMDVVDKRRHLSFRFLGMSLAHAGVAVCIIAAVVDTYEKVENILAVEKSGSVEFQGFNVRLAQVQQVRAPYFEREVASLVLANEHNQFEMKPEKRFYPLHETITSETDIRRIGLGDIYAVFGGRDQNNHWIFKLSHHPAIHLLWLGVSLMVLAGILGLIGARRRLARLKYLIPLMFMFAQQAQADDFKDLTTSLYCPSCQGQILDESNSLMAQDIKHEIYRRLNAGETPDQIKAHFVDLYGEKILLKPLIDKHTYALWLVPFVLLGLIIMIIWRRMNFFLTKVSVKSK